MTLHTQTEDGVIAGSSSPAGSKKAMMVMTALFFMCGFLATLNDILIPHLKSLFVLNYAQVMLVQFSFFSSFLIFSYPSGKLVERFGSQKTLVAGLCTMGTGALLFLPASRVPSFVLFMIALVVLAAGVTALQVSGNPYVSVLGPARTASSRLNLTQAFNSLGSTVAPTFGGILILRAAGSAAVDYASRLSGPALHAYRVQQASYVQKPYILIALTLFALGLIVARQKLPVILNTGRSQLGKLPSLWSYPHVTLGIVAIFLYCGAEITIGSFLVNYISQPSIGAMTTRSAAAYVSIYWGGSMVGRFIGSALLRVVRTGMLVSFNAVVALVLVIATIAFHGHIAMWTILLVGAFNSIMFPSLFTLGIANLGPLTGKASGVLMSGAVGAAVIPVIQGMVADRIGVHSSFLVPAICYLYVAFYGLKGCHLSKQDQAS